MSAFYDLASLVLVPSGTKAQKIYAQKPLTTDGQLAFSRSTTATRVNSAGLIEASAINVPRLDYLNSTCPKLLLEPSRTNLTLYSSELDNAFYTLLNITIAFNNTTSPDGTQSAEKLTETTATGEHLLYAIQSTATGTYTMSAFFKSGGGTIFPVLRLNGNTTNAYAGCVFNTATGLVVNTFSNTYTGTTTKVDNFGNGWYRVSLTTTTNETTFGLRIAASNTATPTIGDFGSISYAGNTNNFFYAWGAQLEAGAYATSYIPTLGASVTRGADAATKTGISSLIGQTEGTIYWEGFITPSNAFNSLASVEVKNISFINLRLNASNIIEIGTSGLSSDFTIAATATAASGTYYKIAGAYKSGQNVLYINGVQVGTSATMFTTATLSQFRFNVWDIFDEQKRAGAALLFKTRLTNAQLAELTTI